VCAFYFTFRKSINIESKSEVITIKKRLAGAFVADIERERENGRENFIYSDTLCRDFQRFSEVTEIIFTCKVRGNCA
jgi:hypothetical protein